MAVNRAKIVDQNFIQSFVPPKNFPSSSVDDCFEWDEERLPKWKVLEIFDSMMSSRLMDIHSRELKAIGESFIPSEEVVTNVVLLLLQHVDTMTLLIFTIVPECIFYPTCKSDTKYITSVRYFTRTRSL